MVQPVLQAPRPRTKPTHTAPPSVVLLGRTFSLREPPLLTLTGDKVYRCPRPQLDAGVMRSRGPAEEFKRRRRLAVPRVLDGWKQADIAAARGVTPKKGRSFAEAPGARRLGRRERVLPQPGRPPYLSPAGSHPDLDSVRAEVRQGLDDRIIGPGDIDGAASLDAAVASLLRRLRGEVVVP